MKPNPCWGGDARPEGLCVSKGGREGLQGKMVSLMLRRFSSTTHIRNV